MLNLEPLAALAANEMAGYQPATANDAENIITTSLGVLAEQGLYAFGLFLATRKRREDKDAADRIHTHVRQLLQTAQLVNADQLRATDMPTFYKSLTTAQATESQVNALRRILLTKQLLETTLTYGRYAAKALHISGQLL